MSIQASLDLRAKASPRSLCVFGAAELSGGLNPLLSTGGGSSNNPFDTTPTSLNNANAAAAAAMAVIAGTERGSLHFRTYGFPVAGSAASSPTYSTVGVVAGVGGVSSPSSSTSGSTATTKVQTPLGLAPKGSSGVKNLPREYFPVDLTSLPGAVVSCIKLGSKSSSSSSASHFLLLLDDNRGSSSAGTAGGSAASAASAGHYAALLVTLQAGSFHVVSPSSLPRMSAATYYSSGSGGPSGGGGRLVYAAGRSIVCLGPETWLQHDPQPAVVKRGTRYGTGSSTTATSSTSPLLWWFGKKNVLPAPGVRAGQDAICVTSQGRVAIVAVGNSFYAVAGQEVATGGAGGDDPATISAGGTITPAAANLPTSATTSECVKILSFAQSSQVHPVICLDLPDDTLDPDWSLVFLASGRDCAVVDLYYPGGSAVAVAVAPSMNRISYSKPRGTSTVSLASPILAAASIPNGSKFVAVLTSDGLLSIRSPSCLAIGLRTVEVGQRPNDFFVLRTLHDATKPHPQSASAGGSISENRYPWIVALAFSAQAKVLQVGPDTAQNLADRLIRHAIDAFGANGFPRSELAAAVNASFTATSYVGPEASPHARNLLKQYLEAVLGLADFESGGSSGWPTEFYTTTATTSRTFGGATASRHHHQHFVLAGSSRGGSGSSMLSSPAHLMCCTALLCLACNQLSTPPSSSPISGLACRAAKACAETMGVVFAPDVPQAAGQVCELIAEKLLREASSKFSLLSSPVGTAAASGTAAAPAISSHRSQTAMYSDFIEAAIWLLRSAGKHERAIEVAHDRLLLHQTSSSASLSSSSSHADSAAAAAGGGATTTTLSGGSSGGGRGLWSRIKYESYTATHLSEIWGSGRDEGYSLVLKSPATFRLLENNPRLGLSVFTANHPQNEQQWRSLMAAAASSESAETTQHDDPLAQAQYAYNVLKLLKSINPALPYDKEKVPSSTASASAAAQDHYHHGGSTPHDGGTLPLESGRALSVSFLESAIGITTGRPTEERDEFDPVDEAMEQHLANFHDELSFLLLEGVIAERRDDSSQEEDTALGKIYRLKLRQLLRWPLAKVRPERFMETLPSSFLQEKALILGRVGRHEDALRILYRDLNSLDLALEYCDDRYERQKALQEERRGSTSSGVGGGAIQHQQWQAPSGDSSDSPSGGGLHYSPQQQVLGGEEDNAYLPLVRVALDSEDTERGITTAIQVLALRRGAIDRAAALRLLPSGVPVSAVARPFLIPALVDSESQVRRLTVVSALLRARYLRLKEELTVAQLKAQANLHVVSQFRSVDMGDLVQSSKTFRVRTSTAASSTMPDLMVVKHFFPKHLVIQAKVTNTTGVAGATVGSGAGSSGGGGGVAGGGIGSAADFSISGGVSSNQMGRILSDIAFVVAESSEEAIQPLLQVPIKVLPVQMTGSAWCVLEADASHMDGATAQLTCELRYTVQPVDFSGSRTSVGGGILSSPATTSLGRTFVEELQDLEVHAAHFS